MKQSASRIRRSVTGSPRLGRVVVTGLVALTLTGCGSTALQGTDGVAAGAGTFVVGENGEILAVDPATGQVLDGSITADGLGGPVGTGALASGGAGGNGAGSSTSGTSTPGTTGVPGSPNSPASSGGAGSWVSAPDDGPLKVGVMSADVGAIFAAFGQEPTEGPPFNEAFAKFVNAKGGLAGRQVEFVTASIGSADDAATAAQKACSTFTQDNDVDIVVNGLGGSEILANCLQAAEVAMIDGATVAPVSAIASKFPSWLVPSAIRPDRLAGAQLSQALSSGLLKRGDHLGVLIEDCPGPQAVRDSVVLPAAQKAGLKVTAGAFTCVTNLVTGVATVANDVQRETLRFASAGVTHVMIVSPTEAYALSNFTSNASQQRYFPKYLVTSSANPWNNSRSDAVIKISDDALPNIYGMGLSAPLDIGSMKPVNAAQATAQRECATIDPSRGGLSSVDANDQPFRLNLFHSTCEAFRVLRTVMELNGGRTAYQDVARAFQIMRSKQVGSASLATGSYFAGGPGQTDGAGALRPFRFDAKSSKWVYTGGPVKVS